MPGWWDRTREHGLGRVSTRDRKGVLVGFVNVIWDGGNHAFLLDTKTRSNWQRRGVGTEIVRRAVNLARAAGCERLHVDFDPPWRRSTSTRAAFDRPRLVSSTSRRCSDRRHSPGGMGYAGETRAGIIRQCPIG